MSGGALHYAGVLVRLLDARWDVVLAALARIPEVDVHQQERESGRVVVTVETEVLDRQTSILDEIRELEGVLLAEPVYAYEDAAGGDPPGDAHATSPEPQPCSDE